MARYEGHSYNPQCMEQGASASAEAPIFVKRCRGITGSLRPNCGHSGKVTTCTVMSDHKSSFERFAELEQFIITREMHLAGQEELLKTCREAGVKRPSLDKMIARTKAALRRLEKHRADFIDGL